MKILSTEVLVGISEGYALLCLVLFFVGIAGIFLLVFGGIDWDVSNVSIGLIMILAGFGLAFTLDNKHSYEYEQHKVLITDYNEVYQSSYEIVDQEGEIFTIQKKGADEQ